MTKELSAADVAAFFASKGIELPAELAQITTNEIADRANEAIAKVLVPYAETGDKKADTVTRKVFNETATAWQERTFEIAHDMSKAFVAETNNVGRGKAEQRKVTVETPDGTLFLRLSKTVK